jgi:hypothetical protein
VDFTPPASTLELAAAGVDGDGKQPGIEDRIAAKALQGPDGGDKGLLCGVFRVPCIIQDGKTQAEDRRLMVSYQGFDCLWVASQATLQQEFFHQMPGTVWRNLCFIILDTLPLKTFSFHHTDFQTKIQHFHRNCPVSILYSLILWLNQSSSFERLANAEQGKLHVAKT